jgi:hypothetical protein
MHHTSHIRQPETNCCSHVLGVVVERECAPQLEAPLRGHLTSCRRKLTAPFFFSWRTQVNLAVVPAEDLSASESELCTMVLYAQVSFLGDAKSSLGDAKSSLGDAKSSLGEAKPFAG